MSKKFSTFDDVLGKELLATFDDTGEKTLIVFEGPEVVVLEAREIWTGEAPTIDYAAFYLYTWLEHADELLRLGVVTQQEVDDCKEERRKSKEQQIEWKRYELEQLQKELEAGQ